MKEERRKKRGRDVRTECVNESEGDESEMEMRMRDENEVGCICRTMRQDERRDERQETSEMRGGDGKGSYQKD